MYDTKRILNVFIISKPLSLFDPNKLLIKIKYTYSFEQFNVLNKKKLYVKQDFALVLVFKSKQINFKKIVLE